MSKGFKKLKGGFKFFSDSPPPPPPPPPQVSRPWVPSDSATLRSWFDPSDNASLVLVGNNVSGVMPRAGSSSLSLTQNSSALQPTNEGVINGVSCLRVETLNKMLRNTSYIIPDNKQFCVVMVVNAVVGLSGFRSSFISMDGSNSWDLIARSALNLTGRLQTSNISVDGPASFNMTPSIGVGLSIISIVFGNATLQVNVDGTQRLSGAYLNNIQAPELQWMADRTGSRSVAGDYGDLIIDDDITRENEHVGYLAHRFAKTADLPDTHPYKNDVPSVTT